MQLLIGSMFSVLDTHQSFTAIYTSLRDRRFCGPRFTG